MDTTKTQDVSEQTTGADQLKQVDIHQARVVQADNNTWLLVAKPESVDSGPYQAKMARASKPADFGILGRIFVLLLIGIAVQSYSTFFVPPDPKKRPGKVAARRAARKPKKTAGGRVDPRYTGPEISASIWAGPRQPADELARRLMRSGQGEKQSDTSEAEVPELREESKATIGETLVELRKIVAKIEKNHDAQEKAWPTRETDTLSEWAPPPLEVQDLQAAEAVFLRKKQHLLRQVEWKAARDITPVLDALGKADSLMFVESLVPIACRLGKDDPRTFETLRGLTRRFGPCPTAVVNGLTALESEEASLLLIELGAQAKSLVTLRAAGKSGERAVLERLADLAEGDDEALAEESLQAILRLTPPASYKPELEELITWRIMKAESPRLKSALIVYLGLFKNQSHFFFLTGVYDADTNEKVRLAVIGALGNLGPMAGDFLIDVLDTRDTSPAIKKACIHSLGASRYKAAVPFLISALRNQELKSDAARALHRIAGRDLGENRTAWARWWNVQPQAGPRERDPDE